MKRIGILGGTFNPIHFGHLAIAEAAKEKLNLEKIIFVPSNLPPHKSSRNVIDGRKRYAMVKLAIEDNRSFEISSYEINKPGKTYSIDTVEYFQEQFSQKTKLFFIVGGDSYPTLNTWKRIDDLLKIVTFVVINRPGYSRMRKDIKVRCIKMPELDISSSYIRRRIKAGRSIKHLLPEKVIKYIKRNKLYCN